MSWVTVIWSAVAGICLTLATVHFLIWFQERAARMNMAFAMWTSAIAATALMELAMMHARTPGQYGELIRWIHLPFAVSTFFYLWFIVLYLGAGRRWLQLLIYGVVVLRLVINFSSVPNFNFSQITALRYIPLWGELVASPIGVQSRWQWIDEVSWMVMILFIVDAVVGAWRGGQRRQAIVIGTCVLMTSMLSTWIAWMAIRGTPVFPVTVSLPSLLIIMVMAYELSFDMIKAGRIGEELRVNQERIRLAAKAVNLGLWEWDVVRDEVWTTDAGSTRVGVGENEKFSVDRFLQSVHSDDREAVREEIRRVLDGAPEMRMTYRTVRMGGKIRWISAEGQTEFGLNGKPHLVRGISMDITERKLTEEAARHLQRYRDMAADIRKILSDEGSLPDALKRALVLIREVSGVDAAGIRLQDRDDFPYACQQGFTEQFLGTENSLVAYNKDGSVCRDSEGKVSLECTCGLVVSGRADPSNPLFTKGGSAWINDAASLLALEGHKDRDPRLNPRNQCIHYGYASIVLAPIRAKARIIGLLQLNDCRKNCFSLSAVEGIEALAATIGETILRKQAEEALRENLAQYRAMVESFDGFIYICSADYRVEFMNQRMIERTGRNAVGEFCYRALHDKDSKCEWCVNEKVLQGKTVRWEVQSPKDNRWYDVVNTPIRHADGTVSKQAMIQDITDRKNAVAERIQLRLELAHLNRVLTMNELSSSLAHEINQPLGAILNNASTAKTLHLRRHGEKEMEEILDDIIADANRAGQIVRKIRGIIRKGSVQFELMDMNALLGEVVELFRNPLNRERITVSVELCPGILPVRGDRIRLQQVVMNLIMNATDAMKESPRRVLTIRSAMQAADIVCVSMSDTGHGIDDKIKSRIFSPFVTTKKNGLGMGLRICKSILEEHGGSIRTEDNPDGGATFSFTLKADNGGRG